MRRVLGIAVVTLVTGCVFGTDDGGPGAIEGPYTSLEERPCPEDSFLTYENFGDPFMRDWCTGCHSADLPEDRRVMAPPEVNLDDLEGVRAHLERVWLRAADDNRTMPPAGGPGAAERALLGEWLACGAPSRADM